MQTPLFRVLGKPALVLLLTLLLQGLCFYLPAQTIPTTFSDRTNLLSRDNSSGVALAIADMNGDGRDDIVRLNQGVLLNIEYQTTPRNFFQYQTIRTISNDPEWSLAIADADRNGLNDILVGGAYNNLKVLYNQDGVTDFQLTNLENSNILVQGTNFTDINNDGAIDIFACNDDGPNRSYANDGEGNFRSAPELIDTRTAIISDNSGNYSSLWTDYDSDGDMDLYISKCRIGANSPLDPRRINQLFQNDGNNNFTEVAESAGLASGAQSWTTDFADIDNDGDLDAFIANHYDDSQLMLNNGNGTFTDITVISGLLPYVNASSGNFAIQTIFRDFNNDGFVDLLFTGTAHFLFYNNGDRTFTAAADPFGRDQIESVAIGDLDHNGYLDVYVSYAELFNTPSRKSDDLYLNNGNGNNFIAVQLEGVASNANGIGAKVELHGSWGVQTREVRSGEGYGVMNTFTQHFGIGVERNVDKIVVHWPSGLVQEVQNPDINTFVSIREETDCAGQACNDGNPCTTNDTFDANCNCVGVLLDTDGDGICDGEDRCPGFNDNLIGQPCSDGNNCTVGETWDNNCGCSGGIYTDGDGDGFCVGQDTDDNDPCVPDPTNCDIPTGPNPIGPTDDPCEVLGFTGFENGDMGIWIDGGDSARLLPGETFATTGVFSFFIQGNDGFASSIYTRRMDLREYETAFLTFNVLTFQADVGDRFVIEISTDNLNFSTYATAVVGAELSAEFNHLVELEIRGNFSATTTIRIRSIADSSLDYFILDDMTLEGCGSSGVQNCVVGTSCDDGDPCTIGSVYDTDCNCVGGLLADSDNDGICDANDTCPNFNNNLIGQPCNDGNVCTVGETWNENCGCSGGVLADNDFDGVCASIDPNDNDPCIPNANGPGCVQPPAPAPNLDCNTISSTGFENANPGIWNPGGSSASLLSSSDYADTGIYSVYMFGNSGVASSIFTDPLNLLGYENINLEFYLFALSMEAGDRFHLEVALAGQYTTVRTFVSGVDFNPNDKIRANLNLVDFNWTNATRFRFRAETSAADDYVILDNIVISGCRPTNPTGPNCVVGSPCDDGNNCTVGETLDQNCNCSGGIYTDADGDGFCIGNDSNDSDPCIPNASAPGCITPSGETECSELFSEDFDNNDTGRWNSGGADAKLLRSNTFANSGSYLFYVQGNNGRSSSLYTDALDLRAYTSAVINFNLFPYSMEAGDKFSIEVATQGQNYTTYKTYEEGVDFFDEVRRDISLEIAGINFSERTSIRFRALGDNHSDYVMLDDIVLSGCAVSLQSDALENREQSQTLTEPKLSYFPNPAQDIVNLVVEGMEMRTATADGTPAILSIYDMQGRLVSRQDILTQQTAINVEELDGNQLYLFRCIIPLEDENYEHSEMIFKM